MALPNYTREEGTSNRIPAGNYRAVVVSAEETESKAGKAMIKIGLRPSGSKIIVYQYIVEGEYYNRNLTTFFDSFDVAEGDMNLMGWIGAMGAVKLKEDENGYMKVAYLLSRRNAVNLPEFEGDKPEKQTVSEMVDLAPDEDLPF